MAQASAYPNLSPSDDRLLIIMQEMLLKSM